MTALIRSLRRLVICGSDRDTSSLYLLYKPLSMVSPSSSSLSKSKHERERKNRRKTKRLKEEEEGRTKKKFTSPSEYHENPFKLQNET